MRRDEVLIPIYLWASVSLLVHLFLAGGTSELARRFHHAAAPRTAPSSAGAVDTGPSEVEFIPAPAEPTAAADPTQDEHPSDRSQHEPSPERDEPEVPARAVPLPEQIVIPSANFVNHRNPNHEAAPDHPRYAAQDNQNVTEDTVAAIRNHEVDQQVTQMGQQRPDTSQQAASQQSTQASQQEQHPERPQTESPQQTATAQRAAATPGGGDNHREGARGREGAQGSRAPTAAPGDGRVAGAAGTPGQGAVMVAAGGVGAVPNAGAGQSGQGGTGGASGASGPRGHTGPTGQNGQEGEPGPNLGVRGLGASRAMAALSPSYSTYAAVYGHDEMERQRQDDQQRRRDARGAYDGSWQQLRASIENYLDGPRVSDRTALRAAASPFAEYIARMHDRIHQHFVDLFIDRLDRAGSSASPLQDQNLQATLEIVLESDGTLHRLSIRQSSGLLPFDVAAINSVRTAAPFGDAPEAIRSYDHRVYLRWRFARRTGDWCAPWHAEPMILRAPSGGGGGRAPATTPSRPTETPPAGASPVTVGK